MNQSTALDILKTGRNVYLTGAAGSGKTHVINEYIQYLRERGIGVGVTASTGIAATHIGGVTIHSWSGIGIKEDLSEWDIEALTQKEYLWKRFDKTKVLIIDEVSMLNPQMFDNIDRICRSMKQNEDPFGGLQIILSGDFFQLPPIVRGGNSIQFITSSQVWNNMDIRVCYLDEQFRQKDNTLERILNEIRSGSVSEESRCLLEDCSENKLEDDFVPTRLYTHNKDVDVLNDKELSKLPGNSKVFEMKSKGKRNLIESLKRSLLASESLKLKKAAVVMFIKNNFEGGYVNGTLGIIEDFDNGYPVVRTFAGDQINVSHAEWTIEEDGKVLAQVEQLPLRLAWAITIHKSQGMSMDAAEIDLSQSFVPGQGYVALSRLRSMKGLILNGINEMALNIHPSVKQLDKIFLRDSEKWNDVVLKFDEAKIKMMHDDFVKNSGGTLDKKEIQKNKAKEKQGIKERVPSYELTKDLIEKDLSLKEIAKERGMTIGTIITHFEKIKDSGIEVGLIRFKPKAEDLRKFKKAFMLSGDTKLAPVHKLLKGEYSYEELRLARLFI